MLLWNEQAGLAGLCYADVLHACSFCAHASCSGSFVPAVAAANSALIPGECSVGLLTFSLACMMHMIVVVLVHPGQIEQVCTE